jgi:hypothetical protein
MRANRAYDLLTTRGGGFDHIEVVEIASGEVVLFWDLLPNQTGRMSRALKTDLAQLEDAEFIEKWSRYE